MKKTSFTGALFSLERIFILGIGVIIGIIITMFVQQIYANNTRGNTNSNTSNTFLTGTVYNSSGGIIQRAHVYTLVANNVYTDSSGKYVMVFPNDTFTTVIHYSAKGYQDKEINTNIIKNTTVTQDVTLQKL